MNFSQHPSTCCALGGPCHLPFPPPFLPVLVHSCALKRLSCRPCSKSYSSWTRPCVNWTRGRRQAPFRRHPKLLRASLFANKPLHLALDVCPRPSALPRPPPQLRAKEAELEAMQRELQQLDTALHQLGSGAEAGITHVASRDQAPKAVPSRAVPATAKATAKPVARSGSSIEGALQPRGSATGRWSQVFWLPETH